MLRELWQWTYGAVKVSIGPLHLEWVHLYVHLLNDVSRVFLFLDLWVVVLFICRDTLAFLSGHLFRWCFWWLKQLATATFKVWHMLWHHQRCLLSRTPTILLIFITLNLLKRLSFLVHMKLTYRWGDLVFNHEVLQRHFQLLWILEVCLVLSEELWSLE